MDLFTLERVLQNANATDPNTPEQSGDEIERSDTVIVIIVMILVTLCFFGILWRCSSCDIENNSMHFMTEEEYEQTSMIELGGVTLGGIGDEEQTRSVDLTLDQALSEDESVAAGSPQ